MLTLDDLLELVDDDRSELGHGPPLKLGLHFKAYHRIIHESKGPVCEGQAGEDQPQLPHHPRDLDEEVRRLAKDQVGIDG